MLIWTYLLVAIAIQYSEGSSELRASSQQCQGSGEPCIEFVTQMSFCSETDLQQAANKRKWTPSPLVPDDYGDLYLWWIAEGTTKRLCCDVKISEPLLIETVQMQWYYYEQLDTFGSGDYTTIQTGSNYNVTEEVNDARNRFKGLLEIKRAAVENEGAYACRVTANTLPPPGVNNATALTIGRISEPIVIKVYSDQLKFETSDAYHTQHREATIKDRIASPYVSINYKVQSVNPRKQLIVTVDTDDTLLQYIDIREQYTMLISTFGDTEYETQFNKDFTINVYYENEEEDKLQRTWSILGGYTKTKNTVIRPTFEFDQSKEEFNKPFSFFVIGSCERFVYNVQFDSGELRQLSFDGEFPETSKEIEDGKYTLKYRFMNSYCSGDLRKKNSYVQFNLSRSDYVIVPPDGYAGNTDLDITVSCSVGDNEIEPASIYFLGLPWFPTAENIGRANRNCLSYNQTSPEEYFGLKTVGQVITSKHLCCRTQGNLYSNTYLWFNGEIVLPSSDRFEITQPRTSDSEAIKDVVIGPLYQPDIDSKRYEWYQTTAGYYQCFVGKYTYQIGTGELEPRYPVVKSRNYKIGFQRSDFKKVFTIDLDNAQSFIPRKSGGNTKEERSERNSKKGRNVTAYQIIGLADRELIVVDGSCVGLTAKAVVFPHEKISWDTSTGIKLYRNSDCTEPYIEELLDNTSDSYMSANPDSFTYSYDPYDKLTIESRAYVGIVDVNKPKTTVSIIMGKDRIERVIKLTAKTPFLETPTLLFSTSGIGTSITCTVEGYPIERGNLTARNKKNETLKVLDSYEYDANLDELDEGHKITLSGVVDSKMETVVCTAYNSLIKDSLIIVHEKVDPHLQKKNTGVTLIVATVIGIALLVLVIWIMCACVAMARNPQTKFGEAMCCRTGPYSQVEKIPMDPYKLEYFTLNPSVTLGGGHFGIVRRGFCTVVPDRAGERTEIAIKEVKPCIDRLRREDDLRRERDIMMRLRSHSNVLRIYGYTDEPDQLALVMEFAAFGSLDKLLVEARKIKSDGYLMPNEQIENPIKAFESQHIVDFGRQISDGMDYVCRNQIVHRDLAARNIVVSGEDAEYVLKITDFGLAREICDDGFYERVEGKEIPIKWTAPESLRGNIYTSKSDVWSYGITLWEICTLGGEPYAGYNNVETMEKLRSGYRLQKPPSCKTELYDLMRQCWLESPDERPDFKHILTQLTNYSLKPSDYVHIDSLYETDLNLTLRLQTLQPPAANNHHPSSSSPPHSPVREQVSGGAGSRDSCNSPRDYHQPADDTTGSAAATMAQNEYSMEPSTLPHNEAV